jgi:hypothetical protein
MAGSLENRGKLRELIDKFQFKKFMGAVSKTRQFELFIFIKCVTIKLVETNYIAKKLNV